MMRLHRLMTAALMLLSVALLGASGAAAQTQDAALSKNLISGTTLSGSTGRIALNSAAGNGSVQANVAAFSAGGDAQAIAAIASDQRAPLPYQAAHGAAESDIGANAFRGASGLVSVNQSSGNNNTQANLAAVAFGKMSEVSIEQLGRIGVAPESPNPVSGNAGDLQKRKAVIADSAFAGAHGIVQINQLAGSGNSTANVFALSISAGTQ